MGAYKDKVLVVTTKEAADAIEKIMNKTGTNFKALEARKKAEAVGHIFFDGEPKEYTDEGVTIKKVDYVTEYVAPNGDCGKEEGSYFKSTVDCINETFTKVEVLEKALEFACQTLTGDLLNERFNTSPEGYKEYFIRKAKEWKTGLKN